ncbi:PTS sugar transporter subunit IIA [Oenococcus oeni]|uniref:PTS sugar transporter subunit IIA n=1 Tax=Oenococcus oeni TaxID=1247 RepID=UPI000510108E|nr:PTS sugar transporter subunit IIA [Oenococcus oeni]KGH99035.1 hypothetical protein X283_03170 [Oenococcus oeni IOEB_1491]KGI05146.1 hypothetical protein X462_04670 [Oenococcus oeni S19]OIL71295.1 hypothetical protein ATX33_09470 [Oenococcus oeni]OIM03315.1 hypothetical protein ATX50_09350 [Oenococcus oeni]
MREKKFQFIEKREDSLLSLIIANQPTCFVEIIKIAAEFEFQHGNCISEDKLVSDLVKRDRKSDTRIFENFALPHCETKYVNHSDLIFIDCSKKECKWFYEDYVKGVFFIILKNNESLENKKRIQRYVTKLADYQTVLKLYGLNSLEKLEKRLN